MFLHAQVVESQIDSTFWIGDDQPNAVHVVAVFLRVVWGQQHPGGCGEVEETRNCAEVGQNMQKRTPGEEKGSNQINGKAVKLNYISEIYSIQSIVIAALRR